MITNHLATAITALRTTDARFPWVRPTDEEDDIAAVLEAIDHDHQPTADLPDSRGRYGQCTGCRQTWPCTEQRRGQALALLWIGRASDRYAAHAEAAWRRNHPAAPPVDEPTLEVRRREPFTPNTAANHAALYGDTPHQAGRRAP